ncbi:MAG: VanZ family protein [Rhizomicrobium sp.]
MSPRKLLHWLRQIDTWLIAPAIVVVVLGELTHSALAQELERDFWDKALHFTAYFGLALMTTIAVRADRRALWWALGLAALGGVLEIIQGVTGRDADIFDEMANTLGAATGLGLGWAGIALLKARRIVDDEAPPTES